MSNTFTELTVKKRAIFNGKVCFNKTGGCDNVCFRSPTIMEDTVTANVLKARDPNDSIIVENCLEVCEPIKTNEIIPKDGTTLNINLPPCETLIVDNLDDPQIPTLLSLGSNQLQGVITSNGSMLGEARRLIVDATSTVPNSCTINGAVAGQVSVNCTPDASSISTFIWDGSNTGGSSTNFTGLGGINLLAQGGNNFVIKIDEITQPVTITLEIYSNGSNYSQASLNTVIPILAPDEITIPFANLTVGAGIGASLTNVGAIKLIINTPVDTNFTVTGFCIVCNQPPKFCVNAIVTDCLIPKTCEAVLIDDFQIAQPPLNVALTAPNTPETGEQGIYDPGIFGGARRAHITIENATGSGNGNFDVPGFGNPCEGFSLNTMSTYYLIYDGNNSGGDNVIFPGLGGIDLLTSGGEKFSLDFRIMFGEYFIEVYTDAGNYSVSNTINNSGFAPRIDEFMFEDFTIAAGTGADFSNVAAIRICFSDTFSGLQAVFFEINKIEIVCVEGTGRIKVPSLTYTPANPSSWPVGNVPTTIQEALDILIELV